MIEKEITKSRLARITLESQRMAVDGAQSNKNVFDALKVGADALKTIHGNL